MRYSPTDTTIRDCHRKDRKARAAAFKLNANDGILLQYLKIAFGHNFWRACYDWWCSNRPKEELDREHPSHLDAGAATRLITDEYTAAWSLLVAYQYLAAYFTISICDHEHYFILRAAFLIVFTSVSLYRIGEILSVVVELHTQSSYTTYSPPRAVFNTLWHYFIIAVAFANVHMACAYISADCYGGKPTNLLTPLYFSVATMTTIGFGDYSPEKLPGQFFVIVEVMTGVVMLVVVIQRSITSSMPGEAAKKLDFDDDEPVDHHEGA